MPDVPTPRHMQPTKKQEPAVRLAADDFDGVFDDSPAKAAAAA